MQQSNNLTIKLFERYLKLTGYAESTIYMSVNYVKEFLIWSEKQAVKEISKINNKHTDKYLQFLKTRKNKLKPGGLSQNTIIGNVNAVKRFAKYLQITGQQSFEIETDIKQIKNPEREILSKSEIQKLYNACDTDNYGIRDRAVLSIYYGCGLRRTEGVNLNTTDILIKENLIFVQKSKGYKQRYVPMSLQVKEDIENYIFTTREMFLTRGTFLSGDQPAANPALLLSYTGKRLTGCTVINRLKKLQNRALLNKEIGLHTLRHSIATHLLQSGMSLENVSKFLGHSSLESTQIYTHLNNE